MGLEVGRWSHRLWSLVVGSLYLLYNAVIIFLYSYFTYVRNVAREEYKMLSRKVGKTEGPAKITGNIEKKRLSETRSSRSIVTFIRRWRQTTELQETERTTTTTAEKRQPD